MNVTRHLTSGRSTQERASQGIKRAEAWLAANRRPAPLPPASEPEPEAEATAPVEVIEAAVMKSRGWKKVTLQDIADDTGLHTSWICKALKRDKSVSFDVQLKVYHAAVRLGYVGKQPLQEPQPPQIHHPAVVRAQQLADLDERLAKEKAAQLAETEETEADSDEQEGEDAPSAFALALAQVLKECERRPYPRPSLLELQEYIREAGERDEADLMKHFAVLNMERGVPTESESTFSRIKRLLYTAFFEPCIDAAKPAWRCRRLYHE